MKVCLALMPMLVLLWLLSSCVTDFGDDTFIIRVDSVRSVSSVRVGQTIVFQLYGYVGPDGRFSFSRIQDQPTNSGADITVWGRRGDADGQAYTAEVVYLSDTQYKIRASVPGQFILTIHQPDATTLQDTVLVNG